MDKVASELAIRNVINLYGLSADCGDVETALACHTEDAIYVVSAPKAGRDGAADDLELHGQQAIREMLNSDMHQSLLPNCAHTIGSLVVKIEENNAKALGYSRVYHMRDNKPVLMRLAFNKWELRNVDQEWKISRRESYLMGEDRAQTMLMNTVGLML